MSEELKPGVYIHAKRVGRHDGPLMVDVNTGVQEWELIVYGVETAVKLLQDEVGEILLVTSTEDKNYRFQLSEMTGPEIMVTKEYDEGRRRTGQDQLVETEIWFETSPMEEISDTKIEAMLK